MELRGHTDHIDVRGVGRTYGTGDGAFEAVRGIDLVVGAGTIVAHLGTNGAGKTSALEVVEGPARPTAGRVRALGLDRTRRTTSTTTRISSSSARSTPRSAAPRSRPTPAASSLPRETEIERIIAASDRCQPPRSGNRPTLNRASVEKFADQWRAKQVARAGARKNRDKPAPSRRVPPEDTGWLHADEVVELTGLGRPRVGQLATLGILPAQWSGHQHLWFRGNQTRRWHQARAADVEQWISCRAAADLIGCSTAIVLAAARRGEIERRDADRTAPSLRRSSVEAFAQRWPERAQQHKDRQVAAARQRDDLRRRTQPPDHDHVWLSRTAAALVLGVSRPG